MHSENYDLGGEKTDLFLHILLSHLLPSSAQSGHRICTTYRICRHV